MTDTFQLTGRILDKSKAPVVGARLVLAGSIKVLRDGTVNEVYAPTPRVTTDAEGRLCVADADGAPVATNVTLVVGVQYRLRAVNAGLLDPLVFSDAQAVGGTLDIADIIPENPTPDTTWTTALADLTELVEGFEGVADASVAGLVNDDESLTGIAVRAAAPGSSLTVQDENGNVSTGVSQIDFQGAGVTASAGTGEVVVTIPGGGSSLPATIQNKTGAYAAGTGDFVRGDTTSGGFTVTLPTAPTIGATISVQKTDASGNVLTVAPAGGGTINGDANATIVARYAGAIFEHLGSNVWVTVSQFTGVGPAGPAGPQGLTGGSGVQGIFGIGVLNSYYPVTGIPIASSAPHALGSAGTAFVGTPFIAPETMTIDALGCYVGTGGASGVIRLGLLTPRATNPYRLALGSIYADKLVETATTIDASSSGPKTATLATPLVIAAGSAVAGILIVQGSSGVSAWSEDNSGFANSPWGNAGGDIEGGPVIAVTATGLTSGAIPATFTPTAFRSAGLGGSVWMRRTA